MPLDAFSAWAFTGAQYLTQAFTESIHRANWIIGWHVVYLGVLAVRFFQHVCGNSEPVSAV